MRLSIIVIPKIRFYLPVLLSVLLVMTSYGAIAQENWKLAEDQQWIKIYKRPITNSKIKSIKVICTLQASISQLLAAIMDVQSCGEWVYSSKTNILLKQISPLELIYYSEVSVPWPVENRDYVVRVKAEQDPQTKIVTVNSPCIPGYVKEKPGKVRIKESVAQWTIIPIGKNQVKVEYILEVDPLGNIPAWLVNLFAAKGPYETFKALKVHVQKDVYKRAHYATIVE